MQFIILIKQCIIAVNCGLRKEFPLDIVGTFEVFDKIKKMLKKR